MIISYIDFIEVVKYSTMMKINGNYDALTSIPNDRYRKNMLFPIERDGISNDII